jgi:hypothetical protein
MAWLAGRQTLASRLEIPANLTGSVHLFGFLIRFALKNPEKALQKLQVFSSSPASRRRALALRSSKYSFLTRSAGLVYFHGILCLPAIACGFRRWQTG